MCFDFLFATFFLTSCRVEALSIKTRIGAPFVHRICNSCSKLLYHIHSKTVEQAAYNSGAAVLSATLFCTRKTQYTGPPPPKYTNPVWLLSSTGIGIGMSKQSFLRFREMEFRHPLYP